MQGTPRRALQAIALLLLTSPAWAVTYTLELESGGTSDGTLQIGDIVNFAFTSPDLDTNIFGNVEISYDPTKLQAIYVDEPFDTYGFWTWWTDVVGDPTLCGSGLPYHYYTGGGSPWTDQWAAEYGEGAGPSAYIDESAGKIRFYHNNYLVEGNHTHLRIGFRLLATGTSAMTIKSQESPIEFDWCDFDTVTATNFDLGITVMAQQFTLGKPGRRIGHKKRK